LENEQPFLADLSFQLSEIYQRPASSIMVILAAETPMLVGGNVEPAYHITITALSLEIAPTKNKRSTALLHAFILESLDIPLERGVIRFEAVAEENLAVNGKTVLQEVEEMERNPNDDDGVLRTISRNRGRMGRKSSVPIFTQRGRTPTFSSIPVIPSRLKPGTGETRDSHSTLPNGTTSSKKSKYRKTIMKALFGAQD
jgi:Macrophage migration inhibitory factor (MIF)